MSIELNAQDVLVILRELERRGLRFYQLAAQHANDPASKKLFTELASMEDQHAQLFSGMSQKFGCDPDRVLDDASAKWDVVAKTFLGGLDRDLFGRFKGKIGTADILREAMSFEKDTMALLLALKGMLLLEPDRLLVDELLREELGHLLQLGSRLAQADRTPWGRASLFGDYDAPPSA